MQECKVENFVINLIQENFVSEKTDLFISDRSYGELQVSVIASNWAAIFQCFPEKGY